MGEVLQIQDDRKKYSGNICLHKNIMFTVPTLFNTPYPWKGKSVKVASRLHAQWVSCSINTFMPLPALLLVIGKHFLQTLTVTQVFLRSSWRSHCLQNFDPILVVDAPRALLSISLLLHPRLTIFLYHNLYNWFENRHGTQVFFIWHLFLPPHPHPPPLYL